VQHPKSSSTSNTVSPIEVNASSTAPHPPAILHNCFQPLVQPSVFTFLVSALHHLLSAVAMIPLEAVTCSVTPPFSLPLLLGRGRFLYSICCFLFPSPQDSASRVYFLCSFAPNTHAYRLSVARVLITLFPYNFSLINPPYFTVIPPLSRIWRFLSRN